MQASKKRGFTMAEVMVAIGIIAVAVLTILALSLGIVRTSQKSNDTNVGDMLVDRLLGRLVQQLRNDDPTGSRDNFWQNDHFPWDSDTIESDGTTFEYVVNAQTVLDLSGDPLGAAVAANNQLKKVDVTVTWWNSASTGRVGYGKLTTQGSILVSQADTL